MTKQNKPSKTAEAGKFSKWQKFVAETEINGLTSAQAYDLAFPEEAGVSYVTKLKRINKFRDSDQYLAIKDATQYGIAQALQRKAEIAASKMLDSFSELLDEGSALLKETEGMDKLQVMEAQRENLKVANPMTVIAQSADPYRNQQIPTKSSAKARAVIE